GFLVPPNPLPPALRFCPVPTPASPPAPRPPRKRSPWTECAGAGMTPPADPAMRRACTSSHTLPPRCRAGPLPLKGRPALAATGANTHAHDDRAIHPEAIGGRCPAERHHYLPAPALGRSEEHTSELQSREK